MKQIYDAIIIGAGASGCACAITAAKRKKEVLLLEKNPNIAKKILSTGNGRCNFTNQKMDAACFHGNSARIQGVLNDFSTEDALLFFHEIGISSTQREGYYYPMSNQAKSVVNAFEDALINPHITLVHSFICKTVNYENNQFCISDGTQEFYGKSLVFATGLLNSNLKGIEESAFPLIKGLGHHISKIGPALCGYYCSGFDFKQVAGVRTRSEISVLINGVKHQSEIGELQWNDYGISGIPVFQLSGLATRALMERKQVTFSVNLLPDFDEKALLEELDYRIKHFKHPLNGLLPDKFWNVILKDLGPAVSAETLIDIICHLSFEVTNYRELKYAQTCVGGICDDELKENTLESALIDGLFFIGELVNVDGICGGYNLHWAWASGHQVGCCI